MPFSRRTPHPGPTQSPTCIPQLRLRLCGAVLGVALALAGPAEAQEPEAARAFCKRGQPASSCRAFLVAHLNYFPMRDAHPAEPWRLVEWEVGGMVNYSPRQAVGAAVAVGTSETGFHAALKGRYRLWLARGLAFDAGAGLLVTQHPPRTYPHQTLFGVTADATLGLTDWVAVSGRAYALEADVSGVEAGVRLGTGPGLVVTVLGLASLLSGALNAP